jgi:hypothetical protein
MATPVSVEDVPMLKAEIVDDLLARLARSEKFKPLAAEYNRWTRDIGNCSSRTRSDAFRAGRPQSMEMIAIRGDDMSGLRS